MVLTEVIHSCIRMSSKQQLTGYFIFSLSFLLMPNSHTHKQDKHAFKWKAVSPAPRAAIQNASTTTIWRRWTSAVVPATCATPTINWSQPLHRKSRKTPRTKRRPTSSTFCKSSALDAASHLLWPSCFWLHFCIGIRRMRCSTKFQRFVFIWLAS